MREDFFNIARDEQLLPFLRSTGRFTTNTDHEEWTAQDFISWQAILRDLLKTKPERWTKLIHERHPHSKQSDVASKFETSFRVQFQREGKFYLGVIQAGNTLRAMIASVYVDWLAGVKQGFCARPDCGKPFEITSAHARRYCSPECAHHQVVKRSRERQRTAVERPKLKSKPY